MEQKSKYNNTKSENILTMMVTWVEIVCMRCFHFIVLLNGSSHQNVHFCSMKNNLCHPIQFIIFCLDYLCMGNVLVLLFFGRPRSGFLFNPFLHSSLAISLQRNEQKHMWALFHIICCVEKNCITQYEYIKRNIRTIESHFKLWHYGTLWFTVH